MTAFKWGAAIGSAVPKTVTAAAAQDGPAYRRPTEDEVAAVVVKVVTREGVVPTQRRLVELMAREFKRRDPLFSVGGLRVRRAALRSGLVGVTLTPRRGGPTPRLTACPVCGSNVKRRVNKTLGGGEARMGYRCARCPWWTGREFRRAAKYAFHALVTPDESGRGREQLTFRDARKG